MKVAPRLNPLYTSTSTEKLELMNIIQSQVESCMDCHLSATRTKTVPGSGNLDARIILVGKAPGRKEDEQGRPFVGSAGKLLDALLGQAHLDRGDIFIGNILKCRPPKNRRPKKMETAACQRYLDAQLGVIAPRVIAPMGNSSLGFFLARYGLGKQVIGDVHGEAFMVDEEWGRVTLFPIYHPAAAIYNRGLLPTLEKDMRTLAGL